MKLSAPIWTALLLVLVCAVGGLSAKDGKLSPPMPDSNTVPIITLKGTVMHHPAETNTVVFRTEKGEVYPLVRNQKSEALFVETSLTNKILIVKGRLQPGTRALEITANLHSWRNGKQHEIYYYCDICAIKTSDPGACMCCREPMKLVEEE